MSNSTNWTNTTINSTGFDPHIITAGDTVVTAGSTTVNALGQDTSSSTYKSGSLFIKSTEWTQT